MNSESILWYARSTSPIAQVVYKEILKIAFIEELLDFVKQEFISKFLDSLDQQGGVYFSLPTDFDTHFSLILKKWDERNEQKKVTKMRTFD